MTLPLKISAPRPPHCIHWRVGTEGWILAYGKKAGINSLEGDAPLLACLDDWECVEPWEDLSAKVLQASNAEKNPPRSSITTRLHKLCFLQKLSRQKPCWDQARLTSLVNKPAGAPSRTGAICPNTSRTSWSTVSRYCKEPYSQAGQIYPATKEIVMKSLLPNS